MRISLPAWCAAFAPPTRYKVAQGGRGSSKSMSIARMLLGKGRKKRLRILCVREFQVSITESVHSLLAEQIEVLGMSDFYTVMRNTIIGKNGTQFIFAGIKTNPKKIKSMNSIDICWVEEADAVSKESWDILTPTIRNVGSEIWVSFNPDQETDPTSQKFMVNPNPAEMIVVKVNWRDNPWFPDVLKREMEWDFKVDPDAAMHVWEGEFRKRTKASIFGDKYVVQDFTPYTLARDGCTQVVKPGWAGPYFGADWGFSQDPDTLVKCWIYDNSLYVEREAYEVACPQNDIPRLWEEIPGSRRAVIRADSSRPETIYHVRQLGFDVIGAEKWAGSVEDGIRWIRGLKSIVFHSRCKHGINEAKEYKYKTDRLTGDVLTTIADKHNHVWDAIRYALQPAIKVAEGDYVVVYDEPAQAIDPDLDEFELREQINQW